VLGFTHERESQCGVLARPSFSRAVPLSYKIPLSVLVVIHTHDLHVLVIRRVDMGTWQSVTGSKDDLSEAWGDTAKREVFEETGIDAHAPGMVLKDWGLENRYEIYPAFRHRYAPGVIHNTERVFGLLVPSGTPVLLNPREHTQWQWLPMLEAADVVFSPSNAEAILMLSHRLDSSCGL
jgi:dihydroneopterin triphosphate diphosphatase